MAAGWWEGFGGPSTGLFFLFRFDASKLRYAVGSSAYEKRAARKANKKESWQQGAFGKHLPAANHFHCKLSLSRCVHVQNVIWIRMGRGLLFKATCWAGHTLSAVSGQEEGAPAEATKAVSLFMAKVMQKGAGYVVVQSLRTGKDFNSSLRTILLPTPNVECLRARCLVASSN